MTIDWTKPILWDGKPARVQGPDLPGQWPKAIYLPHRDFIVRCDINGKNEFGEQRVTNAPERVERWANVYGQNGCLGGLYQSRKAARANSCEGRMALVRYTFEDDRLVDVAIVPLEEGR